MQNLKPPRQLLPKTTRGKILVAGGAIAATTLIAFTLFRPAQTTDQPAPQPIVAKYVTALGRLEPQGEVIKLATSTAGSRVTQLLVQQGDRVQPGRVIAILDSRDRLQAALKQAQEQVLIAQTKLAQVEAGAKTGEINAQRATIVRSQAQLREDVLAKTAAVSRLEAEVKNAQIEFQRYQKLFQAGVVSASQRDSKQLTLDSAMQQLQEARAMRAQSAATSAAQVQADQSTLAQIAEVRPVDLNAARAEVKSAIAAVQQAQADLDLAIIKAPRAGQIIKIYTWPGEVVGDDGIVEMGQTARMYAVAEVYESDLKHVKLGQPATVTSEAFDGKATGTVSEIGLQVYKKNVLDTDPTAAADARVVEVKVRLDPASSRKVAGFTNLDVTVSIARGNG
ncbi:MAG: ABC exporter membrane fusion protein [Aphanocapsa sp. GSE-SYN-MK-11-07L]|jgi:HlyD family secretion protein|nr:ABC exporter membrane fusion protein [Aphanocapsa sp. GSE-SYN-MK-11-07L]